MKKFLSLLLVAVMLLSTLMLSSCDFLDTVGGFFGGLLGGEENQEDNVRRTISEMEWRKIYSSKNFTLSGEFEDIKINLVMADDAAEINYNGINLLVDLKTGAIIGKNATGYVGGNFGTTIESLGLNVTLGQTGILPEIEYNELVYSEETKSYSVTKEDVMIEFHFEEGNLVYALMLPTDVTESGKVEIKNIGTTVFELPEYTDITDGKIEPSKAGKDVVTTVTDEQLLAHLDMKNLTVSANMIVADIVIKGTESALEMKATMMGESMQHVYLTLIDGQLFQLQEDWEGNFVATKIGEQSDLMTEELEQIKPYLSTEYLVYNEAGRYYELEVEGMMFYFYFENGQLVQFVMTQDVLGTGVPMEIIFTVTDVGTTKVELPKFEYLDPAN